MTLFKLFGLVLYKMIGNSSLWVVSDVDGTLMDHSYDLTPAKETIKKLQKLSIPVILCTSKTASEVKVIRKELNLRDPYIVENGAAIYGESLKKFNGKIILGKKYEVLEDILNFISKEIDYKLIPLNNLTDYEATELTGLKGNSLNLMRDRHWSMPFLNPPTYFGKENGKILVITRGENGAIVIDKNEVEECGIKKNLKILDLTGAGDLFAAGFLHGYVNNKPLKESLKQGTEMSSKIIQQIGARL